MNENYKVYQMRKQATKKAKYCLHNKLCNVLRLDKTSITFLVLKYKNGGIK